METYRNEFKKNDDETLWELHEIRHSLYNDKKNKTITEINKNAKKKFKIWKKKNVNA